MYKRLTILMVALLLTACGGEPEVTQWRFALEEIQGSVQDAYAQEFKRRIEARTDGKVEVNIYPYGALGTSANITEQVQNNAMQLAFASPGHLGSVVPEAQLFSLHFLFSEDDRINQQLFADSAALHERLAAAYRDHGLQLLAVVPEGWMVWTGDRPLRTPEDFTGFKIRTMASPLLVAAYEAYGASPTPMPYSEVYSGLQLGMIDGQVNPIFAIEEMSFHEVQEVMTFPRHLPFVSTLIASPDFYDALPPEQRQLLAEVKAEMNSHIFEVQERYNSERLEIIRSEEALEEVRLTEAERDRFRQLSLPVREIYIEQAGARGRALLETLIRERERLEAAAR